MITLKPYITEKTVNLAKNSSFTLTVSVDATRAQIEQAVKTIFKVTPVAIKTLNSKKISSIKMRKPSTKRAFKKAIVKLKAGDKIPGFEIATEEKAEKTKEKKAVVKKENIKQ